VTPFPSCGTIFRSAAHLPRPSHLGGWRAAGVALVVVALVVVALVVVALVVVALVVVALVVVALVVVALVVVRAGMDTRQATR